MVRCCVPSCNNNSGGRSCSSEGPLSFHAIPSKPSVTRGLWMRFINRASWSPTKHDCICSDHFLNECYEANKKERPRLKKGSVPSLLGKDLLLEKDSKRKRIDGISSGLSPQKKKTCADSELDLNDSFLTLDLSDSVPQEGMTVQDLHKKMKDLELLLSLSNARNLELEAELKQKGARIVELECEISVTAEVPPITAQKLSTVKDDVYRRMTGVVNYGAFADLRDIFGPVITAAVYKGQQGAKVRPDRRKLPVEDQLLLVLLKLRMGLTMEFLGVLFKIHQSTVSKVFSMWINAMAVVIRRLNFFPSRDRVLLDAPQGFLLSGYADVRIIVDCFEVFLDRPSHPGTQSFAFSSYKHHCTAKFLIGITPAGKISFMSGGYLGSMSDEAILGCSGLLDLMDIGDVIMADKGFRLSPNESYRGITLITPDFLGPKTQLSVQEMHRSFNIARSRIHVERSINRVEHFRILAPNVKQNVVPLLDEILTVIAFLVNSSTEILKKS